MKVLVFCEQRNNTLKPSCIEALSAAYSLGNKDNMDVAAIVIGGQVEKMTEQLKEYGAQTIYHLKHHILDLYNPIHYLEALSKAIDTFQPDVILGIASPMGRDLFPRCAAKFDAGLITDIIDLQADTTNNLTATKPIYAGKILATVAFQDHCQLKIRLK